MDRPQYIASCSFGKDSLAMVLKLIENDAPLDQVIFYDTGMEFQAIYNLRDRILPILERNGIDYKELKPKEPFLYTMLNRPCESKQKGKPCGYGWCGGMCRWGPTAKLKALDEYAERLGAVVYVGIAADETSRLKKEIKPYKVHPLALWGMTEATCLTYCREQGFGWPEPLQGGEQSTYTPFLIGFLVGAVAIRTKKNYGIYGNIYPNIGNG